MALAERSLGAKKKNELQHRKEGSHIGALPPILGSVASSQSVFRLNCCKQAWHASRTLVRVFQSMMK